jgi:hypothetical protein
LERGGAQGEIRRFGWGVPGALFVFNLQDRSIHEKAEKKLAEKITTWRESNAAGRLRIVAHSAGCGVTLGALARLDDRIVVDDVILLAASVSPQYPLTDVVHHVTGKVHLFFSDRDDVWLKWRTSHFGTYDNIKTEAAGRVGFRTDDMLPASREKLVQHRYEPAWKDLGNDGGHFGTLSARFAEQVLAPLIR